MDEPCAGFDPRAQWTLINLLRELPTMMLVSTHDMIEGVIVPDGLEKP